MNIENRTIFEDDNLDILRGLDSETIDLIYRDPSFNSNKTYEAPIGSAAAGAAFKDTIGVNLAVFRLISSQFFYKCRPYGAWDFLGHTLL